MHPTQKLDKGKAPTQGMEVDKEGFFLVWNQNRGIGKKRNLKDGQEEETFNRFEALEDLVQEEGVPLDVQETNGPSMETNIGGMPTGSPNLVLIEVCEAQMDFNFPPSVDTLEEPRSLSKSVGGSSVIGASLDSAKSASDSKISKPPSSTLGVQQNPLKKGASKKTLKVGQKKDQEKVKLIGETLVDFGLVRTIDSHFSQP